jgi:hypothetical protein
MNLLATVAKWEIALFLAALAAAVATQLLNGQINTRRMLCGRITGPPPRYYFSPERVQLLAVTLVAAIHYLGLVLTNPTPGTFPAVPEAVAAVVGGSNALYLGGKAWARWMGAVTNRTGTETER